MEHKITLLINDGNVPEITFDGKKFLVVFCGYNYSTKTDKVPGEKTMIALGYIEGTYELITIRHNFITGLFEVIQHN